MAAPHSVDPARWPSSWPAASPDVLREMIAAMANALMSAQADQLCGAEYGERSAERTNQRNGYRAREWDTRAGTVELAVPKLRQGSYFPDWLLTHRRRAEQALVTVVATAYLLGRLDAAGGAAGRAAGDQVAVALAGQRDGHAPRRAGRRVPCPAAGRRPVHVRAGSTR